VLERSRHVILLLFARLTPAFARLSHRPNSGIARGEALYAPRASLTDTPAWVFEVQSMIDFKEKIRSCNMTKFDLIV
jgi:hypothetical protein